MTSWRPGQPIPRPEVVPFEEVENFRETPPEGLDIQDVEWIWWTVASSFTYEVLRGHMSQIIERRKDWGCFFFSPIADSKGNSRYPAAVIKLLREVLPRGAVIAVDEKELEGTEEECEVAWTLIIQNEIWHELTWAAFDLIPTEMLPDPLRDIRFSGDLGL